MHFPAAILTKFYCMDSNNSNGNGRVRIETAKSITPVLSVTLNTGTEAGPIEPDLE